MKAVVVGLLACLAGVASAQIGAEPIEAVTFPGVKGVYVPVRELGSRLGCYVGWDAVAQRITLEDLPVDPDSVRRIWDGTNMVDVTSLSDVEVSAVPAPDKSLTLGWRSSSVSVVVPEKWVEISIDDQWLRAFQGNRLVMETNVSTGKPGHRTPTGTFKAGPEKSRMRYSRLYDNSPMPWAIQINGNVFIHGYKSVPRYPASHGCVRMPYTGKNAAKNLFEWIEVGVPVSIRTGWSARVLSLVEDSD